MTSGAAKGSSHSRAGGMGGQTSRCLLPQLAEPRLHGLLPGLKEKDGFIDVDPGVWVCCQGSGFREESASRPGTSRILSCDLAHRLRMVRDLWVEHLALYQGDPIKVNVAPKVLHPMLERLQLIAQGKSQRGLLLATPEGITPGFSLWQLALAATWRFGLKVRVVDLQRTEVSQLLPKSGRDAPQVLCVEGVHRLWEPIIAERFELLVQYAYGGMVPLFVSVIAAPQPSSAPQGGAPGNSSLRGAFQARIAKAKKQLTTSVLGPDCVPKLRSTTTGVDAWLLQQKLI